MSRTPAAISTPTPGRALLDTLPKHLYLDGAWQPSSSGATLPVENPATGEILCEVADAGVADAQRALDVAERHRLAWAATAPRERAELLRATFEALIARIEELALLITLEMGKPLEQARAEVRYAAEFFRWFSEEAVRVSGRYGVAPEGGKRVLTMRQPVGPCLLITPWNFPLAMGARKIAPALAAGCTIVIKPARQTPLSTLALVQALERAGLPNGVLNLVVSSSAGSLIAPLMADARLRKISFTGSTEVGRKLVEQSAGNLLRSSMELGGNAPFVVFADADLDAAVEGALIAKIRNGGEACTAANRFLVDERVVGDFAQRLARRMLALVVGPGEREDSELGPMIDADQRDSVAGLVEEARAGGAVTIAGGEAIDGPGYFYAPTVLTDVPPSARILHEEIFGPVAPIVPFAQESEAVTLANATEYGLVAYLYTRDLDRALRVAEALETGMVGLNTGIVSNAAAPFGGVKASGFGREGGHEGIDEYLETKYVALGAAVGA